MAVPSLDDEQRKKLIKELKIGVPPTPEHIKEQLDREWLRPSIGARKELGEPQWAV